MLFGYFCGRPGSRLDRDQAEEYAARRGVTLAEVERWLASNLAYEPNASIAA